MSKKTPTVNMADVSSPTEYTPRALLVVFGAFTCLFCTVGFLNSSGVFIEYYTHEQLATESPSTIAWLGAISIFFLFVLSPAAGALLDVFGPKAMVYTGSIGLVFCIMMISLCHSFWQFLLSQGVLLGICMALATWPMIALVGQYFKESRAAATGFVVAGSSLGGIVWPIVIDRLLNTTTIGFPWTMRIIGLVMIPCLIFSCVAAKSPESVVQQKDLEAPEMSDTQPPPTERNPKQDRSAARKNLYKQSSMQLTCLAMFITYFGLFAPIFYLPSFATAEGFSTTLAFYTASIVNGASFAGRILPGFVADRYGKFNCCIVAMFASGITILCWTKATSVAGLVVWSVAYGFASGGILSLQQACAAQLATPSTIGLAIGSVTGSTALSAMANVPISGALAEKYGYLSLSIFSGVTVLVGGAILVAARLVQNREWRAIV